MKVTKITPEMQAEMQAAKERCHLLAEAGNREAAEQEADRYWSMVFAAVGQAEEAEPATDFERWMDSIGGQFTRLKVAR